MYWLIASLVSGLGYLLRGYWPFSSTEYAICSQERAIYTVDSSNPRAECFVVKNDLFDKKASIRLTTRIHDLGPGQAVFPGLADAHAHILEYGYKKQLELDGCRSVGEVRDRIKLYLQRNPDVERNPSAFIAGMGWDQTLWEGGQFPTASDFDVDESLSGRLISLRRVDGHAAWVSNALLQSMAPLPTEVEGGQIIRDPAGLPTGVFLDNAMDLIPYPPWTDSQRSGFLRRTMEDALSYGLTSIHDAFTTPPDIDFLVKVAKEGRLPMRLYLMGAIRDDRYWGDRLSKLVSYGAHRRLTLRSVKIVGDGALGSWGAALLEPYSDNPSTNGFLLQSEEVLSSLIERFFKDNWQVNVHCIGDRANNVILDIFERLLKTYNVSETRPRIEHAQVMTLRDLSRMERLGVIPSVQPTHATSDMWYAESRLGPSRIKGAYAYETLARNAPSGHIALGSDFPIEGVNPLLGFYAAISRLSPDGNSPHGTGGWYPQEALTREQALAGMTLGPAYASFSEEALGSIESGKKADYVIFDRNIMTIPTDDVLSARVVATVIDGRVAYGSLPE